MTEMTKRFGRRANPTPRYNVRYAVDPVAFAFALLAAPLLVAVLGFWVIGIPVFALYFGGPAYLVMGTPILLIYLRLRQGSALEVAKLALATVVVGLAALLATLSVLNLGSEVQIVVILGGFAVIIGPLWGYTFGRLYNHWRNDLSRRPIPNLA